MESFDPVKRLIIWNQSVEKLSIEENIELYRNFMAEFGKNVLNAWIFEKIFALTDGDKKQKYVEFFNDTFKQQNDEDEYGYYNKFKPSDSLLLALHDDTMSKMARFLEVKDLMALERCNRYLCIIIRSSSQNIKKIDLREFKYLAAKTNYPLQLLGVEQFDIILRTADKENKLGHYYRKYAKLDHVISRCNHLSIADKRVMKPNFNEKEIYQFLCELPIHSLSLQSLRLTLPGFAIIDIFNSILPTSVAKKDASSDNGNVSNNLISSIGGSIKRRTEYPVEVTTEYRLLNIFGKPYRNSLIDANNRWNVDNDVGIGRISVVAGDIAQANQDMLVYLHPLTPRCIAINERNGYIAQLSKNYIVILAPNGANQFVIKAVYNVKENTRKILSLCPSIRFAGDNIYIFHHDDLHIYHYRFDELHNQITFVSTIYDEYFSKAGVRDIVVTEELLIILFDRWLGVYKLYPSLQWYHALSFAGKVHIDISINSMEMSYCDDCDDPISVTGKQISGGKEIIACKPSIKNYVFINCGNNIIAVHPTNATFDFLHVAQNTNNRVSFCNSRKYGTFWINNECNKIMQSGQYEKDHVTVVCQIGLNHGDSKWKHFKMIPVINGDKPFINTDIKIIKKFNTLLYDEGYGISGRLLVHCTVKYDSKKLPMFYQLFNYDELMPLKQELEKNIYSSMYENNTNVKPFNLMVYVFEMLYGSDLIDILLESKNSKSFDIRFETEEKIEQDLSMNLSNLTKLSIINTKAFRGNELSQLFEIILIKTQQLTSLELSLEMDESANDILFNDKYVTLQHLALWKTLKSFHWISSVYLLKACLKERCICNICKLILLKCKLISLKIRVNEQCANNIFKAMKQYQYSELKEIDIHIGSSYYYGLLLNHINDCGAKLTKICLEITKLDSIFKQFRKLLMNQLCKYDKLRDIELRLIVQNNELCTLYGLLIDVFECDKIKIRREFNIHFNVIIGLEPNNAVLFGNKFNKLLNVIHKISYFAEVWLKWKCLEGPWECCKEFNEIQTSHQWISFEQSMERGPSGIIKFVDITNVEDINTNWLYQFNLMQLNEEKRWQYDSKQDNEDSHNIEIIDNVSFNNYGYFDYCQKCEINGCIEPITPSYYCSECWETQDHAKNIYNWL